MGRSHLGWRESISTNTSQTIFSVHEKCEQKVYPKRESCVHMGQTFPVSETFQQLSVPNKTFFLLHERNVAFHINFITR